MLQHSYAIALHNTLQKGRGIDDALLGLDHALKSHGHEKLKRAILMELMRLLRQGGRKATITIARKEDTEKLAKEIKATLTDLGEDEAPSIVLDDTLIGGFVAENAVRRIDRSYKKALIRLYQNTIHN